MEEQNVIEVSAKDVQVEQSTGNFTFDMEVKTEDAFSGMEFGVICGEGCEVTDVSYNVDANVTEPTKSEGVTWFGLFEGEDCFTDDVIVTVSGNCEKGMDSAISLEVAKRYTVGNEEYKEEPIVLNEIVNLRKDLSNIMETQSTVLVNETDGRNANWVEAGVLIGGAVLLIALLYIGFSKKKKVKEENKK